MTKKTIQMKEIERPIPHEISKPQWSDEETVKIITELADYHGISPELKIKTTNMEDKTKRIAELFKQEMFASPLFKTVTKFLWFPKTIEGKTKWLVTASWQEQFMETIDQEAMDYGASDFMFWTWKPVKWL